MNNEFFKNKNVFITGHTGFKGTWLCRLLLNLGANVYGYSLEASDSREFFRLSKVCSHITNYFGDIRNFDCLASCIKSADPDIIIHLAAQPLVKESYADPVNTYSTNVMGTVNILEAARMCSHLRSIVNVTTDKVYLNRETHYGYKEDDILNGFDPYSNSKSCSELVTSSYRNSFFSETSVAVSSCRAGNVIGGGDFADNRIIPDCYRAVSSGQPVILRNPNSIRPYQHVLEPLFAYLMIAEKQFLDKNTFEGAYNIGPGLDDNITTGGLADLFCREWENEASWIYQEDIHAVHEAKLLYLNCEKIHSTIGWSPIWNIKKTVEKTVEWYKCLYNNGNVVKCMEQQISEYLLEAMI